MSTIEIASQDSKPLDDSPDELARLLALHLEEPSEATMLEQARAEFRTGSAAAFIALRLPEITETVIDTQWGAGTRSGILAAITDEEALALRLFMHFNNADGAETIAREVFSSELKPELEMTQY